MSNITQYVFKVYYRKIVHIIEKKHPGMQRIFCVAELINIF